MRFWKHKFTGQVIELDADVKPNNSKSIAVWDEIDPRAVVGGEESLRKESEKTATKPEPMRNDMGGLKDRSETTRDGEIAQACRQLSSSVERMEKSLFVHRDRLSAALRTEVKNGPAMNGKESEPCPYNSPLAEELWRRTVVLNMAIASLEDLTNRLEL